MHFHAVMTFYVEWLAYSVGQSSDLYNFTQEQCWKTFQTRCASAHLYNQEL